jgi:hypothetical protein
MLLAKAASLRAERDRYLREAPEIVAALRRQGVTFEAIRAATGIPPGTAARWSPTSGNSTSTTTR